MPEPLRIRTPKETIAGNIALLPEADLWRPIIEQADEDGFLPSQAAAQSVLDLLEIDPLGLRLWAGASRDCIDIDRGKASLLDLALIHEYWVSQQPDA